MPRNNYSTKIKKITASLLVLFFTLGFFQKLEALTIADIELLISVGLISKENSGPAREFIKEGNVSSAGNVITIDESKTANQCLVINQNLIKRSQGTLVSGLQKFLKSEGHLPQSQEITGFYGNVTVQGVIDFQLANGLITSSAQPGAGTIGPISRAKIQEITCKYLEVDATVVETAPEPTVVTPATSTPARRIVRTPEQRTQNFSFVASSRKSDLETGEFEVKYFTVLKPKDGVASFEYALDCDENSVEIQSRDFLKCGDIINFRVEKRGKKSFTLVYKNLSRMSQKVTMMVEALNSLGEVLGFGEDSRDLEPSDPTFSIDPDSGTATYSGTNLPENRICNIKEQREFIRYVMTTYDPQNPVYLPNCYPGELMCNTSYPPTNCYVVDGASSDDLCTSRQQFLNGACVDRI
jgi:peptidoglycan hydrolase-like protein with peptidoglycan-binding domain